MHTKTLTGAIAIVSLALFSAVPSAVFAQQYYGGGAGGYCGPGMMGPGMMGPGMMGGMMGPGMMGPGMMGGYYGSQQANLKLTTNDVKAYLERWVVLMGNPRLKAGPVTEKDATTITADIVTTEKDAVVERFSIDRQTGFWRPLQ